MKSVIKLANNGVLIIDMYLKNQQLCKVSLGGWKSAIKLSCNPEFLPQSEMQERFLEHKLECALAVFKNSGNEFVQQWLMSIPEEYLMLALKFPGFSLRILRLAANFSDAEQLLASSPVLLWLVAKLSRNEGWNQEQIQYCLSQKRTLILEQVGVKSGKPALTVINKLNLPVYDESATKRNYFLLKC